MYGLMSPLASRCLASSSRAELHTSVTRQAKFQRPKKIDSKVQAKLQQKQAKDARRVYAVLGSEYNKEDKWAGCDLQKDQGVAVPPHLNYGIEGGEGTKMLFHVLPALTLETGIPSFEGGDMQQAETSFAQELQKANMFAKLVDLRNANARGIACENRRRIVAAFSTPAQPNDTGRPEVQAALLTMQIRNLWSHLLEFRKDVQNRRGLRKLVHQRAKILRYLKRIDRDRYDAVLPRLGLDPSSVEGELLV
ncbi:S15/NS1 RNA-binding domain-containing protein [Melanogaster broomeanus]|nr:S15/NS1 RNA-binding domain-containing protein [Melanogaster broomeanus]